jgi:hypothetical protein
MSAPRHDVVPAPVTPTVSGGTMRPQPSLRSTRRGSALVLTLLLTAALGALAMSAIFLSSNASMLSKVSDREADLRTAADAAVQYGRNMIAYAPDTLPATGYSEISLPSGTVNGADGLPIKNLTVRLWVGPTGSPTNANGGSYASIVADAQDERGGHAVRRLEVLRESFARFAYFSNFETAFGSTSPIYFGCGDQLQGPVFSNAVINILPSCSTKPVFLKDVSTAQTINTPADGDFRAGYNQNQKPISLPSTTKVAYLKTRAAQGGTAFVAPAGGSANQPTIRIEFVGVDVSALATNPDTSARGFVRVFALPGTPDARKLQLLRAEFIRGDAQALQTFCGDYHTIRGVREFYPISEHGSVSMTNRMNGSAGSGAGNVYATSTERTASLNQYNADIASATSPNRVEAILKNAGARCFPAGAPELWLTEWWPTLNLLEQTAEGYHGGTPFTYRPDRVAAQSGGTWQVVSNTFVPSSRVTARRNFVTDSTVAGFTARNGNDAKYLFPIDPEYNSTSKRVIDVTGNVAVSGVVRGYFTLHTTGNLYIIDDLRYFSTPGAAGGSTPADASSCHDILGVVSDANITIADNAIMTPQPIYAASATSFRSLGSSDGSPDATIHGVMMALGTSWTVENYAQASTAGLTCGASTTGRGCLALTGGLIQMNRGAVGTGSGTGYLKRYSYDLCAVLTPPPFFPTTGNFKNNRYAEIDPANFDVKKLFDSLDPNY